MTLQVPPPGTKLNSTTFPHRRYHGALTEVQYAHPDGDNTRDGLTWGTAKKDIVSAYDALPANGGTIFVGDGTFCDSVNTNRGLWIIGPNDPSAGSPPTGFRGQKRLNLVGAGLASHTTNGHGLKAGIAGGSGTDRSRPAIWVSGNNVPITFENLKMAAYAVAVRLGMRADGTNNTTNTSSIVFRNCGFELNQIAGNGPGIELGYIFWLWFHDCVFGGNAAGKYTLTAASITGGTTARFTTSITHALVVGDTVYVQNVTPAGYNGTWTITAVTATTFDADIGSSPGAGSVFGDATPVRSYRRAGIAHDTVDRITGGGAIPSGLIHIENSIFNGGGFHYMPSAATSSGRINLRNITYEGAFGSDPHPPLLHIRAASTSTSLPSACSGIHVQNAELADGVFPDGAVLVDGVATNPNVVTVVEASVTGNATSIGSLATSRRQTTINAGGLWGHSPAAARSFGAAPVPYTNLAPQDVSTWAAKSGTATVTTGQTAPDGTTQAARLSSASNANKEILRSGITVATGDWIIAGTWRRFHSGPGGDDDDLPLVSVTSGVTFEGGATAFVLSAPRTSMPNDGAWSWFVQGGKISTGGATELIYLLRVGATNAIDYYAPVLIRVPAASVLDDDEMRDFIRYTRTYPDGFPAGSAALLNGQSLGFIETTDPTAPSTNRALLYAKDNGSGKTQLVVRFPTGVPQVIAEEV